MVGNDDVGRSRRAGGRSRAATLASGVALCLGLSQAACGGDTELGNYPDSTCDLGQPPSDVNDEGISIATFWSDGETKAFDALTADVRDPYYVSREMMPSRVDTQRHIRDSFENRRLPDLFQVNGGSDILRWVERGGGETDVCALDRLRDNYDWSSLYLKDALEPLSCDGSLYGLPVGIHHINVMLYNRPLFERLSAIAADRGTPLTPLEELTSPQALVELLARVEELGEKTATGEPIVPLAMGASSDWPLTIVAFENVLLGLGNDAYRTLWMGGLQGDDGHKAAKLETSLHDMLEVSRQLLAHSTYDRGDRWQDSIRLVGAGSALLTIMGDWAYAQLEDVDKPNVATVTFPGTQGKFVYTPDSFAVPRELGKNGYLARHVLHNVFDNKAALLAFANKKHALPPLVALDPSELEPGLRDTYQQFTDCRQGKDDCELLLAVSGLGPSPGALPCLDDAEALLALAMAGKQPSEQMLADRTCPEEMPTDPAHAEARLIKLWLEVGQRRFVAGCR